MSDRSSTSRPISCSARHTCDGVPGCMPRPVGWSDAGLAERRAAMVVAMRGALAIPKSRILTVPSVVKCTLPGFKSRWTTRLACAALSAEAS